MTTYRYLSLQPVADGVWAALAGPNAGIVDLGDQTLIFDTFADLGTARELRAAAETLTGRQATFVINSHAHADHYNGNVIFADHATLVSSSATRDSLVTNGTAAMGRMKAGMSARAEALRAQLASTTDETERANLTTELGGYETFLSNYPTPEDLRLPTLTFDRRLTFHGSRRTAHLITYGGAHSPCDAVLWLPDERILFIADLVIPGGDHVVTLGTPERWLPILDQVEALGAATLVPGHKGVVPAAEGFAWTRQYLTQLFALAGEAVASGEGLAAADRYPVPAGCTEGQFRTNLRFLIQRRMTKGSQDR